MGHVRHGVARGLGRHEVPAEARSHDLRLGDMFTLSPGGHRYVIAAVVDEIDGHILVAHPLESVVTVMAVQDDHGPLIHNDRVLDHAIPVSYTHLRAHETRHDLV